MYSLMYSHSVGRSCPALSEEEQTENPALLVKFRMYITHSMYCHHNQIENKMLRGILLGCLFIIRDGHLKSHREPGICMKVVPCPLFIIK